MGNLCHFLKVILAFQLIQFHSVLINCQDLGKLTCTSGTWLPDAKILGLGLSCPLPLDGKSKSKGKTTVCAFKKAKLYDEANPAMKKEKISEVVCSVFLPDEQKKNCKKTLMECLKKGKGGYFKDPKKDTELKSWSDPFECMETWVSGACKK